MPQINARLAQSASSTASTSKRLLAARIISAVAILFLTFDGAIKQVKIAPVVDAFPQLGYPISLAPSIGILALVCTAVYAIPRTSVLGAVLLTGYLGGAIASQVRIGAGLFPVFFPLIIGALVWGGLFLRENRLAGLLPSRS
jgi:DoxX-like family